MCYTLQLFQVKTFRFVNVQLFIKLAVIGGGQIEGRNQKICLMSTLQTGKLDYISWGYYADIFFSQDTRIINKYSHSQDTWIICRHPYSPDTRIVYILELSADIL